MDLQDQLKNLFPDHVPEVGAKSEKKTTLYLQEDPILCKYEKRKGKPITILEGYNGNDNDLRQLAKLLKTKLSAGGSAKEGKIIVQGNFRDKIMEILRAEGFKVKRVGG